jgi:hypothetical protein
MKHMEDSIYSRMQTALVIKYDDKPQLHNILCWKVFHAAIWSKINSGPTGHHHPQCVCTVPSAPAIV